MCSESYSIIINVLSQVSHHPPVSAFYVTNRHDGYVISGSILAKSKFYGNSLSGILDGLARLTFLKRGEEYRITMPYAHCKGYGLRYYFESSSIIGHITAWQIGTC